LHGLTIIERMNADATLPTSLELEAGLDAILKSPKDSGALEMIVRRPQVGEREVLTEAVLDLAKGLVGDNWPTRSSSGTPNPDSQVTVMNARAIALVAQDKSRWPLAGDQLFIDLDLSDENLPAGTRLAIGSAVIEVSAKPHTGCKKFLARFGQQAVDFVNSPLGLRLHLRGINARIVQPGTLRVGDIARKLS
jgi:MOSC domain-containing protein YiiM